MMTAVGTRSAQPFEIDQLLDELARHLQPRSGTAADAQA